MAKIQAGQALDIHTVSQMEAKVGDYKWSHLDETPFDDEHLGEWMLCNGQSATGTEFETATGNSVVPDAFADGAFVRQAKSGRTKGTFEADKFGSHNHGGGDHNHPAGIYLYDSGGGHTQFRSSRPLSYQGTTNTNNSGQTINTEGGVETNPKNIALNLYVKVNY